MTAGLQHERAQTLGREMNSLAAELFPLCRSMTGAGVRQSLSRLTEVIPLKTHEVPTGTKVFGWEVPREWNIREAYIEDAYGQRIVDFRDSNLHVVGYSVPVNTTLPWSQLKPHLHTLPDRPDWIPYRNSYGADSWGFCLSYRQYQQLEACGERSYKVCIDSSLKPGHLSYGEAFLPGTMEDEVLISTHICHPSLANDNLSGVTVATFLAKELLHRQHRYSYRFLFVPATIGPIAWLALNSERVNRIKHGWVLSCVGDSGSPTYKRSRQGEAEIDRAFACVLEHSNQASRLLDFEPFGCDERQYCSPGFNIPMGCLMRSPPQGYPEYHTSADNLELLQPESLADSWTICWRVIELLEANLRFINPNPYCEPRLGSRGLYQAIGSGATAREIQKALLWVLNLSDGSHSLLDISLRSKLSFDLIRQAADLLCDHDLLVRADVMTQACFEPQRSWSPSHGLSLGKGSS